MFYLKLLRRKFHVMEVVQKNTVINAIHTISSKGARQLFQGARQYATFHGIYNASKPATIDLNVTQFDGVLSLYSILPPKIIVKLAKFNFVI